MGKDGPEEEDADIGCPRYWVKALRTLMAILKVLTLPDLFVDCFIN